VHTAGGGGMRGGRRGGMRARRGCASHMHLKAAGMRSAAETGRRMRSTRGGMCKSQADVAASSSGSGVWCSGVGTT
jgi:hypothetical protein